MSTSRLCTVINSTKASIVCASAFQADTLLSRLRGLLGRKALGHEAGLLIIPSSGVHTFGMRFAIDIVAFDRNFRVLGVWESVGPGKIRGLSFRTHGVLELMSGLARQSNVTVGDQLLVTPVSPSQAV